MTILNKEKILELARAFIDEGKYDKAIREYEKILLADPTELRVKLRIAELYTKRKQINDAIRIYREVASAYTAEGFLLKAVTVFKNILRLNPSLIEVNEELAELYAKMGLTSDAVRQFDILAASLDMKGMIDKVIGIRQRIIDLNPKDGAARVRLAEVLQRAGRMDEAIDQYEEYARQLSASGVDRTKLADVLEKILAHRPGNQEMIRKVIGIYEEIGDQKKALKWLEQGKDVVERDPQLLKLAAAIYASQNLHETARNKYMALAELYKQSGDIEAALDAFFEILVMLPDEEERLSKKVDEMKPGAMPDLAARALVRRKELEEEEQRRQEALTAAEAKPEAEVKAKAEVKVEVEVKVKAEVKAEETKPEPQPQPQPQPEIEVVDFKKESARADGSYSVGIAYKRMGLADESIGEFKKALVIYRSCVEHGFSPPAIQERIREIESMLAVSPQEIKKVPTEKKPENKVRAEVAPEPKPQGARRPDADTKAGSKQGTEDTSASKKKRISFV